MIISANDSIELQLLEQEKHDIDEKYNIFKKSYKAWIKYQDDRRDINSIINFNKGKKTDYESKLNKSVVDNNETQIQIYTSVIENITKYIDSMNNVLELLNNVPEVDDVWFNNETLKYNKRFQEIRKKIIKINTCEI